MENLREEIKDMKDWLVEVRRTIHQHPELGFEEVKTSRFISQLLEGLGLDVRRGVAKTGVFGLLKGREKGKTVAVRAEMDGLPINEANTVSYISKFKGKMHACGHDAHMAIILGVAKFFSSMKDRLKGNIKFIFQPAEEGGGGGKLMVEEGVLEDPNVDAIFGAHVYPLLPVGKIGIYEGVGLASADRFKIKLIGQGGHAAMPHLLKDPIIAAGHLITQIHSIVSRNLDPLDSGVISIGRINGGTAFNIIPEEVELIGTIRSLNPQVREELKSRMENVTRGISQSFEIDYGFDFEYGYPVLVNDNEMSKLVVQACAKWIGEENIEVLKPSMGSEDFAFYLEKIPGAFFRLGIRNEDKGIVHPYHSSHFDIDEDVLPFGVEMFVRIIDHFLSLNII